ncbi:t22.1 [Tupaiid betaherpesvirus 1]|uniref:T22.1 n=1 Tax=Tupaiid herpesvirus 1 (strain 1) TaxID=10397 RepID=Q91TT8_TUHV1|nr:t22.1 [Tupaiid betaherpesvirus 1]AAK57049.1 t22.1 [Tupaiid betaherpesvirus 1]
MGWMNTSNDSSVCFPSVPLNETDGPDKTYISYYTDDWSRSRWNGTVVTNLFVEYAPLLSRCQPTSWFSTRDNVSALWTNLTGVWGKLSVDGDVILSTANNRNVSSSYQESVNLDIRVNTVTLNGTRIMWSNGTFSDIGLNVARKICNDSNSQLEATVTTTSPVTPATANNSANVTGTDRRTNATMDTVRFAATQVSCAVSVSVNEHPCRIVLLARNNTNLPFRRVLSAPLPATTEVLVTTTSKMKNMSRVGDGFAWTVTENSTCSNSQVHVGLIWRDYETIAAIQWQCDLWLCRNGTVHHVTAMTYTPSRTARSYGTWIGIGFGGAILVVLCVVLLWAACGSGRYAIDKGTVDVYRETQRKRGRVAK